MDLQQLTTTLLTYGTVDFCNYNGNNTNELIIVIHGFNNTVDNINSYNETAITAIQNEFPILHHFGLNNNTLKVVYSK